MKGFKKLPVPDQLEVGMVLDPAGEGSGHGDVLADHLLEPLDAVVADDEPQLQRSKAAADRVRPSLERKQESVADAP